MLFPAARESSKLAPCQHPHSSASFSQLSIVFSWLKTLHQRLQPVITGNCIAYLLPTVKSPWIDKI